MDYLDPDVTYSGFDFNILQNVYEPLIWYNGSSSTEVIPWLAQNYTTSANLLTYNFTLRSGITFADGEPLNSSAVYFSLNRVLLEDGSTPSSHGTQASWILQQLLNTSLSSTLCGCTESYNSTYVNEVLAENFVQITGPLTFTIHVSNPNSAFAYLLANQYADILAPNYVMQHDLALWNQSSAGYTLPYPTLNGNESQMINEYFMDEAATCNSGATPKGCGTTYLDGSYQGSLAGTGPYTVQSFASNTNDIVLQANTKYWGGPYQYLGGNVITPQIPTIHINYVPSETTRELDLENAAKSGQAMTVDIEATNLYDVANRTAWLTDGNLVSIQPGVTMYGPYNSFITIFEDFNTNVTDRTTGSFYKFQPFADIRMRLAFADAVNMSEINADVNNNLGQVAINAIPPGLPPQGAYNSSVVPRYSYNLTAVQDYLLQAMENPITNFNFENGTAAPSGLFNNTFGCTTLNSNGQCGSPVPQTITLVYDTGDSVAEAIFQDMAQAVNNVSSTYKMGLTVSVEPLPYGAMISELLSSYLYMSASGWGADYPWSVDFLSAILAPGHDIPILADFNLPAMGQLYNEVVNASATGNIQALLKASSEMNALANQEVEYFWAYYPLEFFPMTSNVHGFFWNPSLSSMYGGVEYFATLY